MSGHDHKPKWTRGRLTAAMLASGCLLLCSQTTFAAEKVWSVEKLLDTQSNWGQLVGTPLRVEGRVSSQVRLQMRFQKCDLNFLLTPELERRQNGAKSVEVFGRLQRDGNRYQFEVMDLKVLPSDREVFQAREASFRSPRPAEIYELASWAVSRGTFYSDQELRDLGRNLEQRGFKLELQELPRTAVDERLQLAERAASHEQPVAFVQELTHDGFRAWLTRALQKTPPEIADLMALEARIKTTFPEAFVPLKAWPTDLTQNYATDPTETYRTADENQRKILHRLLGADVVWPVILHEYKADGSNGSTIAARIDQLVPERRAMAEQYRDRELEYRLIGIETAPRAAAVELAAAFRSRQRNDRANETLQRWLSAKERRLRPEEAPQFLELADDYWSLVRNEPKTVALLSEAHRREPQSDDVLSRFESLGYEYDGIRWKKRGTSESAPMIDIVPEPSTIPTQLEVGMTSTQLEQLLGRPSHVTVIRSAASIDEIRVFGRAGEGSRIVVQLRRGPGDSQLVVTRFDSR